MSNKKKVINQRSTSPTTLGAQYKVIIKDLAKLKTDIKHGFDLAKEVIETKISRRNLSKTG